MVSERVDFIGESATLKMAAKVKAMVNNGIDVIDLSVGEPDFPTPDNIKAAAKVAIDKNFTKYTQTAGIPQLKNAIIKKLKEENGLEYTAKQIVVSCGAKHSLYNVCMSLIDEGDEVIVPAPFWVSYPEMVTLAEGRVLIVPTREEDGFKITPRALSAAITPKTKALILNNPSNPTGAGYTIEQLEELAKVILEENIYVIADEIYEKLIYEDFKFSSFASLGSDIKDKTIVINGVSKAYSMTGWRIGFAAGPLDVMNGVSKIQSHSTSNPSSVSQMAALEAFGGPQYEISRMVSEFQKRRNYILQRLRSIPDVSVNTPEGAFYVFPNFSKYYNKEYEGMQIRNSHGLTYYLLKHAHVATTAGADFGSDDFIRMSYANSLENITIAMDRLVEAISKLKTPSKVRRIHLNNTITTVKQKTNIELIDIPTRDDLVSQSEENLTHDSYYEWNANINGVIVQLRTNIEHLYNFWMENWYPAQLETDIEPHGIIYALGNIKGKEPHSYYNTETKTGIIHNTDYYKTLRNLAVSLVTDVSQIMLDLYCIRGMSIDMNGKGALLVGPKGTKKTEHFYGLMQMNEAKLHAAEFMIVRHSTRKAIADNPERKTFIPTNMAHIYPPLFDLFERSKCENVNISKEDCRNKECLLDDNCDIEKGSPFCFKGNKKSSVLFDPYWIGGPAKHIKRTSINWIFLLTSTGAPIAKMETDEMLHKFETSFSDKVGTETDNIFYNPYLIIKTPERIQMQRRFFRQLIENSICHTVNSGGRPFNEVQGILRDTIAKT